MDLDKVKLEILKTFLLSVSPGDDATLLLQRVCENMGYDPRYVEILFPGHLSDILTVLLDLKFQAFAENFDRDAFSLLRTKDRIKFLLMGFLRELNSSKMALNVLFKFPTDAGLLITQVRASWRIIDEIWYLAGDESVDFNFYTKRALLFSVFVPSFIFWLRQNDDFAVERFLDGLLIRVNRIGKIKAKLKDYKMKLGKIFT